MNYATYNILKGDDYHRPRNKLLVNQVSKINKYKGRC